MFSDLPLDRGKSRLSVTGAASACLPMLRGEGGQRHLSALGHLSVTVIWLG